MHASVQKRTTGMVANRAARHVLLLTLLLLLTALVPSITHPRVAVAVTPLDDDFNDNSLAIGRWKAVQANNDAISPLGPGGTVTETNGRLEMYLNPEGLPPSDNGYVGVGSLCGVSGDLDIRVDYTLLGDWTSSQGHWVQLFLASREDSETYSGIIVARAALGTHHTYARYQPSGGFAEEPTSDTSGRLRLVRTGSTVQAYYWNGGWLPIGGATTWLSGNAAVFLSLNSLGVGAPAASAAFDNLEVVQGTVTCPIVLGHLDATYSVQVSPNTPGDHGTITTQVDIPFGNETVGEWRFRWPAGFAVASGASIDDGSQIGTLAFVLDNWCVGPPLEEASLSWHERPLAGVLLRARNLYWGGAFTIDALWYPDQVTGGHSVAGEVSAAEVGAPPGSPACPPLSVSSPIWGEATGGQAVLTNPDEPGLYPFGATLTSAITKTEFFFTSCVAIGGEIGIDFIDADGDCALDEAIGGGSPASVLSQALDPDPANPDIDGDGLPDGAELTLLQSNPLVGDSDGDGLSDLDEATKGSDPNSGDPDADGILDISDNCPLVANAGQENNDGDSQGDVCDTDDDNDGMLDAWEVLYPGCVDPFVNDNMIDADSDALNNFLEFGAESAPCDPDTDDDNLTDGAEVFSYGTSPITADSDSDGLSDGDEVSVYGTEPLVADTDFDGCADGEEAPGPAAPAPKPGSTGPFDPLAWYDFYDVPVPANPDLTSNGPRSQAVTMADVLAVLVYVGAYDGDGGVPNTSGVAYDSIKGSCDYDADTTPDKEGLCYDRSPSAEPNPPWNAGPPSGAVNMADVLAVLVQVGLSCTGPP
jgi:hypothetical protein